LKEARKKFGASMPLTPRVVELIDVGKLTVILGTFYKKMKLKPSKLQDLEDKCFADGQDRKRSGQDASVCFASDDDTALLEDESGRIQLHQSGDAWTGIMSGLVTGLIVALRGCLTNDGTFEVKDLCTAGMAPQPTAGLICSQAAAKSKVNHDYVLLVSGLNAGNCGDRMHLPQILADYITGHLGSASDVDRVSSRIVRVIIAGNSVELNTGKSSGAKVLPISPREQQTMAQPLQQLDLWLAQVLASVPVDLMPGASDPTNYVWPQQPLHPCLLPTAARYSSLRSVSNPHHCVIGIASFLGSAGQNTRDVLRCTTRAKCATAVSAAEKLLRWSHMAPTAPDTLGCYPFHMRDPFVINESPHVFFSGNCESFETSFVTGPSDQRTRVVCLPQFSTTGVAALVSLTDLSCVPLKFA